MGEVVDLASSPMFQTLTDFTSVGYGWHVKESFNGNIAWHNGKTGGFSCFIAFDKKRKLGTVLCANNGAVNLTDIGLQIMDKDHPVKRFPKPLNITEELLREYEGTYSIMHGVDMTIRVSGKRIFAQLTDQEEFEIYPETEQKFFYKVTIASIDFVRNSEGEVIGLTFHQSGTYLDGKKTIAERTTPAE